MAINETLKFSWGHIIAFVALIIISYLSSMGITYLTNGDFLYAGIGVLIIDVLIILFFIIPQILKGADEKFRRKIIFERILFFAAPIVFLIVMWPYAHFWNVFENKDKIETIFSESIKTTKGMFKSYEEYANSRIKAYDLKLAHNKTNSLTRKNKVDALKLQLIDKNYTSLKNSAFEWIDNASGATVWNAFMIGNIQKIESALDKWNSILVEFSSKKMIDEDSETLAFSNMDESVRLAKEKLSSLRNIYTFRQSPNIISISIGIALYILLLFPYIIQSRNTKSTYRILGSERSPHASKRNKNISKRKTKYREEDDITININNDNYHPNSGDYDSFTM